MKIRPSLRLYFFATMVLLRSLMAIGCSFLSVNYFIDGLDRGLNGVMHLVGWRYGQHWLFFLVLDHL